MRPPHLLSRVIVGLTTGLLVITHSLSAVTASPSAQLALEAAPDTVLAQQFQEGQLVQDENGTLYVFESGELHRIEPVRAPNDQVGATPQGAPVTTGVFIIPPPVAELPPPAPGESLGVRLTVLSAQRPYTASASAGPNLEWILLRVRLDNLRDTTLRLSSPLSSLQLRDANGATRDVDWARRGLGPAAPDPLGTTSLLPGASAEGNVLFRWPVGGAPPVAAIWVIERTPPQVIEAPVP
jgi:hypothetical protein